MATQERSFSDFLSNMNEQTNSGGKKQQYREPEPIEENEEYEDEEDDIEDEDYQPSVSRSENRNERNDRSESNLDIMEKSLEYTRSVIKVIKENFSAKEQKMILETLRNTINMSLGESQPQAYQESYSPPARQQYSQPTVTVQPRILKNENASPMLQGTVMSEEEWNRMGEGEEQAYTPPPQSKRSAPAKPYNRELNLGLKMGANGKPEVDLSNVTTQDINEMKLLAGIK